MNALLWVMQILLAIQSFSGGAWKLLKYDAIAGVPAMSALSRTGWGAVGVFEMVCAVLLVVPRYRRVNAIAAAALVVESLALAAVYGRYSLALVATNPLPYVLGAALVAAFIAYGRLALRPA